VPPCSASLGGISHRRVMRLLRSHLMCVRRSRDPVGVGGSGRGCYVAGGGLACGKEMDNGEMDWEEWEGIEPFVVVGWTVCRDW
jgi:hypothetical protein